MPYYGPPMGMDMEYNYMPEYPNPTGSPTAELIAAGAGMESERYQEYLEQYNNYMAQLSEGQQPDPAILQQMQEMASAHQIPGDMGVQDEQYWHEYAEAMNQGYLDTAAAGSYSRESDSQDSHMTSEDQTLSQEEHPQSKKSSRKNS